MKSYQTLLYYKYTSIPDAEAFTESHLSYCKSIGMLGRIIISDEGINGTVSGSILQCKKYMDHLLNDPVFKGMEFKIDGVDQPSFDKIFVRYRPEIVNLGRPELDPTESTIPHLSPEEVLAMKDEEDVYMLDTRNNVEHEVGQFKNAITLDIETFRDFPEALDELEELKDKKIIAYCTGGIRCEKATMIMKQKGFLNVFQIDGGIVKYAKQTGGKDFDGKMYVFDKRIAVEVNQINPEVISKCRICDEKESRMVNCANPECNEHFVLCESCGWKMQGCCSETCMKNEKRRDYDGTGYYSKGTQK